MAKGVKTGGGSRKGRPNKITRDVKEAILQAFENVGGHSYLETQASANPAAFMTLLGKVLPTQVTGANGQPLLPPVVQFVRQDGAGRAD